MTVWFTSDLHLGHAKIAEHRGHTDTDSHDAAVISAIHADVRKGDQLWILGDISSGGSTGERHALDVLEVLARGIELHLIAGNHDSVHPMHRDAHKHQRRFLDVFASVQPFARRRIAGHQVLLSHFPYSGDHTPEDRATQYRLRDEGLWLLHGHTHSHRKVTNPALDTLARPADPRRYQIHVGWDAWKRPVQLDEIAAIIEGVNA